MSDSTKKTKILIAGPLPPPYMGPTLATEVILKSRLNDVFEIHHLDTSDHRSTDTLGNIDFWNLYLPITQYLKLIFALINFRPALVYIPISQTTLGYLKDSGFILIGKLFRKKILCHLHGGNFKNWLSSADRLTKWYVKRVHKFVDGQIVLGKCLKYLFEGIVPSKKIHVVRNGKDVNTDTCNKPSDTLKVLFLSNLKRSKGTLCVLHSVPNVFARIPNVEFLFVGDWPERDVKSEFYDFLQVTQNLPVKYLGLLHGEEKERVLGMADLFVFPTYYPAEGHPLVLIEAMAFGLPIISTDQGAIKEIVLDKYNGFIVEQNSPQALEEKIVILLEDKGLRRAMGKASRKRYEENFTEQKMVHAMESAINLTLRSHE